MSGAPVLGVVMTEDFGGALLEVRGEVDVTTADCLWHHVEKAIEAEVGGVVIDLGAVSFFDSTGIAVLTRAWQRLEGTDRTLVVRRPQENVRRVLHVCGLDKFIAVDDAGTQPRGVR
jgi:anti-anti-sigma factor